MCDDLSRVLVLLLPTLIFSVIFCNPVLVYSLHCAYSIVYCWCCVRVLLSELMNSRKQIYDINLFIYELAQ